ncbi:MAG: hypothetical protein H8F28_16365, partial [Fibrella sp.]|nr:hypothetical protein [Armatimonadota bacterium]
MNTFHVSQLRAKNLINRAPIAAILGLTTSAIPIAAVVMTASPVRAQETDTVSASQLAGVGVPGGAMRVRPGHVPDEVTKALRTMMESAGNKVKQGRTELLVWETGKKNAKAGDIKSRVGAALRRADWEYTEGEPDAKVGPFTLVTALRTTPARRALVGFWVPTDEALILAWTEMLPANAEPTDGEPVSTETKSADAGHGVGQIFKDLKPKNVVTPPVPGQHKTAASNSSPVAATEFTLTA